MTYNCLLTVLTDEALIDDTLSHAVAMAQAHDAHLDVLCMGVDRSQTGYYYAGASAIVLQETITRAHDDARAIEAKVKSALANTPIRWGSEIAVSQLADLGRHVAARSRFADLVILPQPYGDGRGVELEAVTEAALFQGHTPALILPSGGTSQVQPDRVLIAWNESVEAMSAVRAAMTLMQGASQVRVVVIDPPAHGPNRSDPGGQLSQYLARHGLRVEIDVVTKTLPRVSDVMLRHATDMDADMIVMGAYGHSRFRESLFGGATRNVLEKAPLPVLMAH